MAQKILTIKGIVQKEFKLHDGPHNLSDKDVEALRAGKEIDLDALPRLQEVEASPHDLSDKDIEALAAGEEVDLGKRARLGN